MENEKQLHIYPWRNEKCICNNPENTWRMRKNYISILEEMKNVYVTIPKIHGERERITYLF